MLKSRFSSSLASRVMRGVLTLSLTAFFLAFAAVAVVLGLDLLVNRATASQPPVQAEAIPVEVAPLRIEQGYLVERRFVGQIESRKAADLSFELGGRLTQIDADEGDQINAGQEIARLDTELLAADRNRLRAAREALAARLDFARKEVTRNERLSQEGFASQRRLDEAVAARDELTARIAETDANLQAIDIRLKKSRLVAPFTGRVAQRAVDGGETLVPGQTVLRLIDDAATAIRVGLPLSIDPARLDGSEVDIGGKRYAARLDSVRPDIDPITRTRTVILSVDGVGDLGLGRTWSAPTEWSKLIVSA